MQNLPADEEKSTVKRRKSPYFKMFAVIVGSILVYFFVSRIDSVINTVNWFITTLAPILWGIAFAYLLNPVLLFFEKRFGKLYNKTKWTEQKKAKYIKRSSIALTVLFGILLITSLLLLIIPEFYKSLEALIKIIPDQLKNFNDWLESQKTGDGLLKNLALVIQSVIDYISTSLVDAIKSSGSSIISKATSGIISVVGFLIDFFIAIVTAVYALSGKRKFIGQGKKLIYALFTPDRANDILTTARHGHKIFGKYLSGKIIDSLILGVLNFIIMTIFGMEYTLLVSTIMAFTNIIPYFGPFIGGLPSAFIIMMTDFNKGIIFIIITIVLQQIEGNIIEPKIIGTKTGISEFWVTFSLLLFGGLFGFLGMIIAVPLFAVLYYIIKMFIDKWLKKKNLPLSSESYVEVNMLENGDFTYLPENDDDDDKTLRQRMEEYIRKIKEKSENKKKSNTNSKKKGG
jgi:predicted PurR-regulated permease PerM